MPQTLKGKTVVMSGGSRGIGLAIALRAARDGANVVLIAKTDQPHPRLPGTIHTAADEIREAGGQALSIVGDVRSEETITGAVEAAVDTFGGVDVCVNNASVLNLSPTLELEPRRFDLMQAVNMRATFLLTRACLPHLLKAPNPHVLTLSPPLNMDPRWLGAHPGYMVSKYGMTLATLGVAAEFADRGLAANCLWPRTTIATAAVENLLGGGETVARSRRPEIMADAAYTVVTDPAAECSGHTFFDDEVLRSHGVEDLSGYAVTPGEDDLEPDLFT